MTETISLRVFWTCMLLCAGTVLSIIWRMPAEPLLMQIQLALSLFVVGLAGLLIWITRITYRFYAALDRANGG